MFSTIQGRMLVIFAAFGLLVGGLVVATRGVLGQQADDGVLVNLAGRERMLTQKMTKESLQLTNALLSGHAAKASEYRGALRSTMQVFETTLLALRDGGPAPLNLEMSKVRQLPPAETAEIRKSLDTVISKWESFKRHLNQTITYEEVQPSSVNAIIAENVPLLTAMNASVGLMQKASERKVESLALLQNAAVGLAVLLVAFGAWFTHRAITTPIVELASAAQAMSKGDLNVEFNTRGTREVRELSASFDRMRASMMAAFDAGGAAGDDL